MVYDEEFREGRGTNCFWNIHRIDIEKGNIQKLVKI